MRSPGSFAMLVLSPVLSLVLAGCGSSTTSSSSTEATSGATSPPVSSAPLHGTVAGKSFTAQVALGRYLAKSEVAEILVFDTARTCADYAELRDGWDVHVTTRWQDRVTGSVGDLATIDGKPVGTASSDIVVAAFESISGNAVHNASVHDGRVEVVEAHPDAKSHGRVRVRATSAEGHDVEGEVAVEICAVDAEL